MADRLCRPFVKCIGLRLQAVLPFISHRRFCLAHDATCNSKVSSTPTPRLPYKQGVRTSLLIWSIYVATISLTPNHKPVRGEIPGEPCSINEPYSIPNPCIHHRTHLKVAGILFVTRNHKEMAVKLVWDVTAQNAKNLQMDQAEGFVEGRSYQPTDTRWIRHINMHYPFPSEPMVNHEFKVFRGPRSLVFPQAENREWTIMAMFE